MTFSQQMDFTNETNQFMRHCGIRITMLEPQRCQAQLSVEHYCKNTGDTVHGGLLYTMADCVVSAYARAIGNRPVTLSGDFHYLSNVTSGVITATAEPVHTGKTVQVFHVTLTAGEKLLATGTFSCFDRGPAEPQH